MDERTDIEIKTTLDALRPLALDLRRRGYDAGLWVEHRGAQITVEIRVRIPAAGVPMEAVSQES